VLWQTHLRIANEVLRELNIAQSSEEAAQLREGSILPDKWGDYPHHHGKGNNIEANILRARESFLSGDIRKACFHLGVALHYIQDSYTSLSSRSAHHERWEQQIQEAYVNEDLTRMVNSAFHNDPGNLKEYSDIAKTMSQGLEGKPDTIGFATRPGPGLSFWGDRTWGKPYVDFNLALRASILIAKSVFCSATNDEIEQKCSCIHAEFESILEKTEEKTAEEVVKQIEKREKLVSASVKEGRALDSLRSVYRRLKLGIQDYRINRKMGQYDKKSHLSLVATQYWRAIDSAIKPHQGWYKLKTPEIDISRTRTQLISIEEACRTFKLEPNYLQDLIRTGYVSSYHVAGRELVLLSRLEQALHSTCKGR